MAPTIKRGDRGIAVRELQGLLNTRSGGLHLVPDGHFGQRTEDAARAFQRYAKLTPDGIVGQRTWAALHRDEHAPPPICMWFDPVDTGLVDRFFRDLGRPPPPAPAAPTTTPPTAKPPIAKLSDQRNYRRLLFPDYRGQGYIINDFLRFKDYAIRLLPSTEIRGPNDDIQGFKNECAQFVQYFGVPSTTSWHRGPRVCDFKPGELPQGTVVSTLRDGKYYSDYSGRSHVGIYLNHDDYATYLAGKNRAAAVTLFDQWNGTRIGPHKKLYAVDADQEGSVLKNGRTWEDKGKQRTRRVNWVADGEEYYVLLTDQ